MERKQYIDFIEKLIEMTKKRTITWDYLNLEETLCEKMRWVSFDFFPSFLNDTEHGLPLFEKYDQDLSFVSFLRNTYIVLLVGIKSALPNMYIIPSTGRGIVEIKPEEFGVYITRLHNLVKRNFPHGENFIIDLLSE